MNIDENSVLDFLRRNKERIEINNTSGYPNIIGAIAFAATTLSSSFEKTTFGEYEVFIKFGLLCVALLQFILGIKERIISKRHFKVEELYNRISECVQDNEEHPFNIIIIKNKNGTGRYLLHKKTKWGCFLFPDYKVENNPFNEEKEKSCLIDKLKSDIFDGKDEIEIEKRKDFISNKFSVNDGYPKKYHFYIWIVKENSSSLKSRNSLITKIVRKHGHTFKWMTMDEMRNNKVIMERNRDVVDQVRAMELS